MDSLKVEADAGEDPVVHVEAVDELVRVVHDCEVGGGGR